RVACSGSGAGGVFGLFAWDGSVITTLDSTAGGAASVNAVGDIAIGSANRIRLWDHATRTSAVVVTARDPILGPERVRLRAPTLPDSGALAFVAPPRGRRDVTGGVFGWTAATGVFPIARAGDPSPLGGTWASLRTQAVAVNGAGTIAFIAAPGSATGAFLWDPASGTISRVMHAADPVDGVA